MSSWKRLEQVIKYYGFTTNSFAKELGLKRAESLYQIKRGNYSISKNLASRISDKFPDVSESWLLTGEGTMLGGLSMANKISFYNIGVDGFNLELLNQHTQQELEIPFLSDCDFAIINNGEAMSPEIVSGSIVILKEVDVNAVILGDIYMVLAKHYNVIRFVRHFDTDSWRLIAKNDQDYDDIIVKKKDVEAVYKVMGVLSMLSI